LTEIPIEERDPDEVARIYGKVGDELCTVQTVGSKTPISNYAFDVTPARLVTGLITERGICAASEDGLTGLFPEHAQDSS
jgi:methylthioribose-1-phosphate isomerase